MIWEWIVLGVISIVLIVITVKIWKATKRRKQESTVIPQEVLSDLEYVERRTEESNGEINPQQILFELAQRKSKAVRASLIRAGGSPIQELPQQSYGRKNIQSDNDSSIGRYQPQPKANARTSAETFRRRLRGN